MSATAFDARRAIQQILGADPDGNMVAGGESETLFKRLMSLPAGAPWPPAKAAPGSAQHGDGRWPFTVEIVGEDQIVRDIVITCFGGAHDPQDNGDTASGKNTKRNPELQGVSLAMDGRQFSRLSTAEHHALDGSPIPRLPWGTLVEVTIAGVTFTPRDGVLDLGPGLQASKPGEPHALDLTEAAAALFQPRTPRARLSRDFEARGDFRIIGGARFAVG